MKVRIIQSVEIEEVPIKLSELLDSVSAAIDGLRSSTIDCKVTSGISYDSPLKYELLKESVVKLQEELTSVGQDISDIDSILEGYIKIIKKSPTHIPVPVPVPKQDNIGEENADKG